MSEQDQQHGFAGIRAMATSSDPPSPGAGQQVSFIGAGVTLPVRVDEYSAMTYSAVYRAIDLISSDIAMLPWHVFERMGDARLRLALGAGSITLNARGYC